MVVHGIDWILSDTGGLSQGRTMEQSLSKTRSSLALLCDVVAVYGIGFGIMMIPVGLFVGVQVLSGAAIHIGFGVVFQVSGAGIRSGSTWAVRLASITSIVLVGLGIIGISQAAVYGDAGGAIVCSFASLYFACVALVAFRAGL